MTWLLILLSAAAALDPEPHPAFEITKVESVSLAQGSKVLLRHTTEYDEDNSWVLGRFQSEKCYPEEGKLGERFKDTEIPGRPWVQFWTMLCNNAAPGSEVRLEFWHMKPQNAELYFNDFQAYVAQFGAHPEIKFVTLKVTRPGDL